MRWSILAVGTCMVLALQLGTWDGDSDFSRYCVDLIRNALSPLWTSVFSAIFAVEVQANWMSACVFDAGIVVLVIQPIRTLHLPDQNHTCNQ